MDARTGALGERMKLFKRNKKNSYILSEKDKRWNRFIEDVCFRNLSSLSKIQRKAVITYKNISKKIKVLCLIKWNIFSASQA